MNSNLENAVHQCSHVVILIGPVSLAYHWGFCALLLPEFASLMNPCGVCSAVLAVVLHLIQVGEKKLGFSLCSRICQNLNKENRRGPSYTGGGDTSDDPGPELRNVQ